jgi:2-isopropylmalate synthase
VPSSAGMGHDTTIYDTTLRDGCQGAGISLALRDKLDIARRLDEAGIDYVEGGWPGSNPKDAEFFAAVRETPLRHARVSAFGSTRRAGVRAEDDQNLLLLVEAGTPTVALVAKAWDFHVREVLHTTLEENLAMVADSVAFAKTHGREVVFDAEHFFDGHRANREYALAVLRAAAEAGADWLVLCDTNGGSLPDGIAAAVREVVDAFGVPVGIHAHNDGSLAVANSLAAVAAGATQVQGTINGYGERVGNANLCSIVPNLVLKMGRSCEAGKRLRGLTALSHYVDDVANVVSNPRLPFVGWSAFAHKGGIHVHAVAADPTTYEHVDPALVGNERHILVGELSGRSNVVERARELGFDLDPRGAAAKAVADRIKALEHDGFQLEDAEASFELIVRRAGPGYEPPLEAQTYRVDSRKGGDDERSASTAVVEVAVEGKRMTGEADGGGPVDALEKAFRAALAPAFPELERVILTNFRAQIVGGRSGTRAPVRVRITGSWPDGASWTTVGCSSDLLHASWLALADCFEYAVLARQRGAEPVKEATT